MTDTREWQDIDNPPSEPMAVLLFFGNRPSRYEWTADMYAHARDERVDVGWWDGEVFRVNGTGHEAYESWWMEPEDAPTNWTAIPARPAPQEKG